MQRAGANAFGPPGSRAAALSVLYAAIEQGIDPIDTSGFYGPHITHPLLREALQP